MIFTLLFSFVANADEPVRKWVSDPTIVSCNAAIDSKIESGVRFWNSLGYDLKFIGSNKSKNICKLEWTGSNVPFKINNTFSSTKAAETTTYRSGNIIVSANVNIKDKFKDSQTIINHEIGHVLGFVHTDEIGHLMNGIDIYQGNNISGLRKKQD